MQVAYPKKLRPATADQSRVLDALVGGNRLKVETNGAGRRKISVTTKTGKPVEVKPSLIWSAIAGCFGKGWIDTVTVNSSAAVTIYVVTDAGKKARKK